MAEATPRPPVRHDRGGLPVGAPVKKHIIDFPRAGKRGVRRWIPSWKLLLGLFTLGVISVITLIGVAYARTPVPGVAEITEAQTSIVYYDDGKTEIGRFQVQNRVILTGDKIPKHLKDAVIAAEDRTFWTNKGVSPRGIARAAWNNFNGGSLQGGSTLTQQYVKNVLLDTQQRTYQRKIKEFFIAVKVARDTDKEKILDAYLNTIYFGRNSYGVEAASQTYFHKPARKLNVSQSAFIAGIINGPELYDPSDGKDEKAAATIRWNYVLDSMVETGAITADQRAGLKFPKIHKRASQNNLSGQRGYLMKMVQDEVKNKVGLSQAALDRQGMRITTTFNKKMVDAAVNSVNEVLPKDTPKGVHVAVSTIDPKTGAVKAIYGGKDFLKRNYNSATQDIAQAGSTFKAFTLLAALDEGIGLKSTFDGHSPQEFEGFVKPVYNFSNEQEGTIDLVRATQHSVNTVYVALNQEVGAEKTKAAAIRAGLPKDAKDLVGNPANVLGTASLHPIDMATAYGTIANEGVRNDRYVIQKITGPIKYTAQVKGDRAFPKDVTADATHALQSVVEGGTGAYVRNLGRPVAGKTGTSSENKSAWFVGYTPQLSTSVAMYREGKDKKGRVTQEKLGSWGGYGEITGGSFPAVIWTTYMKQAVEGTKVEDFPKPAWIGGKLESKPTWTGTSEPKPSVTPTTPTQEPETPTPTPTEPVEPTVTEEPTERPSPTPTEDPEPTPTPEPTEEPDPEFSPNPSP